MLSGNARSAFGYPQNVLRRFSADTPHRTVRAVFPHTALRVGLVSSVSLPFVPRLRFTLIPMDAPPYGRAVSDAPPHSGLSPIAAFRHYCSRHLICIVPFTRRGPSHPRALPRLPATTASSDYCSRLRYWQFSQVPLQDFRSTRTRLRALRVAFGKVPSEPLVLRCMPPLPRRARASKSNWPRSLDFTHRDLLVTRI